MTLQKPPAPIRDQAHLDYVRSLPCCVCGKAPRSAAAHIRFSDAAAGTLNPGMQRKPCDSKTVPLCDPGCHKEAPGSQHDGSEREFWQRVRIDPFALAARLWAASGAAERHSERPVRIKKARPRPRVPFHVKQPGSAKVQRKWASRPFPAGRGFGK